MNGPKWNLLTALVSTLCAVLWVLNAVRHDWGGVQIFNAVLWSIVAAIWWVKYCKSRQ